MDPCFPPLCSLSRSHKFPHVHLYTHAQTCAFLQEPAGRTLARTDKFKVNPKFNDRMRRLRVGTGVLSSFFPFLWVTFKFNGRMRRLRVGCGWMDGVGLFLFPFLFVFYAWVNPRFNDRMRRLGLGGSVGWLLAFLILLRVHYKFNACMHRGAGGWCGGVVDSCCTWLALVGDRPGTWCMPTT